MTDFEKLHILLKDDRLSEIERKAFGDMRGKMEAGRFQKLTAHQLYWVNDVYRRLEKEAEEGCLNLHSAGKVPQGFVEPKRHYEKMPLPTRPPGR